MVSAPTVSTSAATNITGVQGTANGSIDNTGGENASTRGFCYLQGTGGDPTTANSVVNSTGSFGTGAYSLNITGLLPNTNYRVRAYAINSAGTAYGVTIDLLTIGRRNFPIWL